jgi:cell division protease FtsH
MSPLGPISFGDNHDTVFLGRDITRTETVSEETARKIDAEIHRIIAEQHERARGIIQGKRDALDKIAAALLQYETIEGKHVLEILQFGEIRTPVIVSPPPKMEDKAPKKPSEKLVPPDPLAGGAGTPAPTPA